MMKRLFCMVAAFSLAAVMAPHVEAAPSGFLELRATIPGPGPVPPTTASNIIVDGKAAGVPSSNPAQLTTAADQSGPGDTPLLDGIVKLSNTVNFGPLTVQNATAQSFSPGTNPTGVIINSSAGQITNTGASTAVFSLEVFDIGFATAPIGNLFRSASSGLWSSEVGGSSVRVRAWIIPGTITFDANNNIVLTGATLIEDSSDTATAGDLGYNFTTPFQAVTGLGSTYSAYFRVDFTLAPNVVLTGRQNTIDTRAVPEPATMGAALVGLLGVALMVRRRKSV